MKQAYFTPEVEEIKVNLQQCIAQSGGAGELGDFDNNVLITEDESIFGFDELLF